MFISLLTVAFIVLKLTGVITWTWFWVLSPIFFILIIAALIFGIGFYLQYAKGAK